ncbi:type I glyceraldehyde-3-phosphate dehydrogenase [Bartonella sp. DGB1]|uniref:type I glyceraldehyde-3-phosphate dehydrogenase n=1 Tax=Bartonella sp. DGB1 TaxID=3239807 RepID=UPI003525BA02
MTIRIAINGFGRIGRTILRALVEQKQTDIQVVAINDSGSLETNAHLLRHDSIHGKFSANVEIQDNSLIVASYKIHKLSDRNPQNIDWKKLGVDIVLECTGAFTDAEKAAIHLKNGAKKVIVSAPSKGADITVVYGINHRDIKASHNIISNASCTTNCLAPVAKILNDTVGIEKGFMTTIHSYTGDQPTLDKNHRDLYRARAAALSIIPTSTGAAKAVSLVLPELAGKLDGVSMRVPTPNVSAVDLKFISKKPTTVEEINNAIKQAATEGDLVNILGYCDESLVSCDFNHDPRSSIFHLDQTKVIDQTMCRILSWYDNEWGFSNRMVDTTIAVAKTIS